MHMADSIVVVDGNVLGTFSPVSVVVMPYMLQVLIFNFIDTFVLLQISSVAESFKY